MSDEGSWGSKNDVPGAQSLNTCWRVLPLYDTVCYILVCVAAPAPTVFRVQKGRLVMSHGFKYPCMHAQSPATYLKTLGSNEYDI